MELKTVKSSVRLLSISPRKLQLVADLVKNMTPQNAILQMKFCRKKASLFVLNALKTAISNAENNYNIRIENLLISNISVGKARCMRRFRARAKGRSSRVNKFLANLYISLSVTN